MFESNFSIFLLYCVLADHSFLLVLLPGFYATVDHSYDESVAKNDIVRRWSVSLLGSRRRGRKRNRRKKKGNTHSNRRNFKEACKQRNLCRGRRTKSTRKRDGEVDDEVGSRGNGRATNQSTQEDEEVMDAEEIERWTRELFPERYVDTPPPHPSVQTANDIPPVPEYNDATNTESHTLHCCKF